MQLWMISTALLTSLNTIVYNKYRDKFLARASIGVEGFDDAVCSFTVISTFLIANFFLFQAAYKLLFYQSVFVMGLSMFLCLWLLPWHLLWKNHETMVYLRVLLVDVLMTMTALAVVRISESHDRLEFFLREEMSRQHEMQVGPHA